MTQHPVQQLAQGPCDGAAGPHEATHQRSTCCTDSNAMPASTASSEQCSFQHVPSMYGVPTMA
jgi:hypothetical protein